MNFSVIVTEYESDTWFVLNLYSVRAAFDALEHIGSKPPNPIIE